MTERIPSASLVAGMAPDEEMYGLWRMSLEPYFETRPSEPDRPQSIPEIHEYNLGKAVFIDTTFFGQRFVRDRRRMALHDDVDHLVMQVYVRGGNDVVNGGTSYTQRPGNLFAVNLAAEVDAKSWDSDVLTLVLPRNLLREELPYLVDACGALFPDHSAGARIVSDYMRSLRTSLPLATADDIPAILHATLGLLESMIVHGDIESSVAQGPTFQAMARYVDANLADPGLGADRLCAHFRCSRSTLFRLFKAEGGVRAFVQRRRLMASFKALVSPRNAHRGTFDIALDFGFGSPSHFSHLFRDYFGMSPSDAKQSAAHHGPRRGGAYGVDPTASDAERMWQWAKSLKTGVYDGG